MCNQVTSKLASRCVVLFELRMFKSFPPAYRIRGGTSKAAMNHHSFGELNLCIDRWSHGGSLDVALGAKRSTHVPILSVGAEYQIRSTETSTSMTCFRLPSNFCAEKVMHLILGWDCRVFHSSITSVGVSGKNLPHQNWKQRLPLTDFAPTVRSFHANVLQKCPAPQEKAVAWRVYVV